MTAISRRIMLGGIAATAGGAIAAAIPLPESAVDDVAPNEPPKVADEQFDLQHWLDTAEANAVVRYHAARLAEAMGRIDPSRTYSDRVSYADGYAFIVGNPIDGRRAPVAKVRVDDGSPLFADDVTGTTAFANWYAAAHGA